MSLFCILLCIIIAQVKAGLSTDYCKSLASINSPTFDLIRDCYAQFPFVPATLNHTVTQLVKAMELYIYTYQASPIPKIYGPEIRTIPSAALKLDFIRQMTEMVDKEFRNEFEWQEALREKFNGFLDAHTVYIPNCFNTFTFTQPFHIVPNIYRKFFKPKGSVIVSSEDEAQSYFEFVVIGLRENATEEDKKYLNKRIVKINGKGVHNIFTDLVADRYSDVILGTSNTNARVHSVHSKVKWFSSPEPGWRVVPGLFCQRTKLPDRESITWEFEDGRVYTRKWDIIPPRQPFKDGNDYYNKFCVNHRVNANQLSKLEISSLFGSIKKSSLKEDLSSDFEIPLSIESVVQKPIKLSANVLIEPSNRTTLCHRIKKSGENPDYDALIGLVPVDRQPLVYGLHQALYTLKSNPSVAIWVISGLPTEDSQLKQWHKDCAQTLREIVKIKAKKVLLDLQSNSGGNPCMATDLANALMKNAKQFDSKKPQCHVKTAKYSELFKEMTKAAEKKKMTSFNPELYLKPESLVPFTADELLQTDNDYYIQRFVDNCPKLKDSPLEAVNHKLLPEDFIVITDSLCSSACGRFAYHLIEFFGVKSFAVSTVATSPEISSYPAAQVYQYKNLVNDAYLLDIVDGPEPLLISAQISFTIRSSYSKDSDKFIDGAGKLADFVYQKRVSFNPDVIWEAAAEGKNVLSATIIVE